MFPWNSYELLMQNFDKVYSSPSTRQPLRPSWSMLKIWTYLNESGERADCLGWCAKLQAVSSTLSCGGGIKVKIWQNKLNRLQL